MPKILKWTDDDIQAIKDHYKKGISGLPPELTAKFSKPSIYNKAHKLGFTINGRKPMGGRIGDVLNLLPPTDLAYIAGIFDGEGWVSTQIWKNGWAYLQCGIGSTNYEMLAFIHKRVPHSRILDVKPIPNRKRSWTFKIQGQLCIYDFLDALLPYLIIKRPRALEAMSQIRTRWSHLFDS